MLVDYSTNDGATSIAKNSMLSPAIKFNTDFIKPAHEIGVIRL